MQRTTQLTEVKTLHRGQLGQKFSTESGKVSRTTKQTKWTGQAYVFFVPFNTDRVKAQ